MIACCKDTNHLRNESTKCISSRTHVRAAKTGFKLGGAILMLLARTLQAAEDVKPPPETPETMDLILIDEAPPPVEKPPQAAPVESPSSRSVEPVVILSEPEAETSPEPEPSADLNETLELTADRSLLNYVTNRSAASFDPAGFGFGQSFLPGAPFSSGQSFSPGLRRYGLRGSISVSEIFAEQSGGTESGQGVAGGQMDRTMSTQLSGTVGATLGLPQTGRYLDGQYAGSVQSGGQNDAGASYNQAFTLSGHYGFSKLRLNPTATYAHTTGTDRDFGQSIERDVFSFSLNGYYPLSVKSSLDLTISHSRSEAGGGSETGRFQTDSLQRGQPGEVAQVLAENDANRAADDRRAAGLAGGNGAGFKTQNSSVSVFFDRQTSVKTRVGIGVTTGRSEDDVQDPQDYQQLNFRVTYIPTRKLTANATIGYELRQVAGQSSGAPVVSASLAYAVRAKTSLTMSVSRAVINSAAESGSNYTSSAISASATQQIGSKLQASLSLGYQNAVYDSADGSNSVDRSANGGSENGREDDFLFASPSLIYQATRSLSLSLSYTYGDNRSTERSFRSEQLYLTGTYSF